MSKNPNPQHCPGCKRKLYRHDTPVGAINVLKAPTVHYWYLLCCDCTQRMPNIRFSEIIERRILEKPDRYSRPDYGLGSMKTQGVA